MGRKAVEKKRKELDLKQQIWLSKLLPFFYENGIRKVTMDEIAEQIGVSKATIYNYFKSKDELLEAAVWQKMSELRTFGDYLVNEDIDFIERYYLGVKHFTENLSDLSVELLNEIRSFYPNLWTPVQKFQEIAVDNIRNYYQTGIDNGIFNSFNITIMAQSDRIFFDLLSDARFLAENELTIREAFEDYFNNKFNGILAENKPEVV